MSRKRFPLGWHAGHRALHTDAQAGALGTLRHMRVQWPMHSGPENWRAQEELATWWCLSGVGTHCLDQIRWFMRPTQGEVVRLLPLITKSVYDGPHELVRHGEEGLGGTAVEAGR